MTTVARLTCTLCLPYMVCRYVSDLVFGRRVRTPSDDLFYESRVSPERAGERVGDEQKRGLGIFSSSSPPFRPCLWEIFSARRTKCGLTGEPPSLPPSCGAIPCSKGVACVKGGIPSRHILTRAEKGRSLKGVSF